MNEINAALLAAHAALIRGDYTSAIRWCERALELMRAELDRMKGRKP